MTSIVTRKALLLNYFQILTKVVYSAENNKVLNPYTYHGVFIDC